LGRIWVCGRGWHRRCESGIWGRLWRARLAGLLPHCGLLLDHRRGDAVGDSAVVEIKDFGGSYVEGSLRILHVSFEDGSSDALLVHPHDFRDRGRDSRHRGRDSRLEIAVRSRGFLALSGRERGSGD
jgi:hypothetical protein